MSSRKCGLWPAMLAIAVVLFLPGLSHGAGLWMGQIEINQVNEVGFGVTDRETTRDVANPFDMPILLHEDAEGKVRLLRHVTLMQKRYEIDGTTEEMVRRVLVTNDNLLSDYEGVTRRDGKLVGIRIGTLFFDFDQSLNELPVSGKIGVGDVTGKLTLSADHPHNPFRHLYHPDHRSGRELRRDFTLTFAEVDPSNPNAEALELNGDYHETLTVAEPPPDEPKGEPHEISVKMKGTFQLERVSTIAVLNDKQ